MKIQAGLLTAALPEGLIKNWLRRVFFKGIFLAAGKQMVELGPPEKKVRAIVVRFPFHQESLGEREMIGYLRKYQPRPGDVVINAGAYHGYFAIYLSRLVGQNGKVICFEPEKNNLKVLRQNIKLNGCENVQVIEKGLWDSEGYLPIIARGSGSNLDGSSRGTQKVKVTALDEEMRKLGIRSINFLTMDIEGAEIKAVDGAKKTIMGSPDINIAIASYHLVDGEKTCQIIEKKLREFGLQAQTDWPKHLTTYAWR